MITNFDRYKYTPNINDVDPKFWKMIGIVNWKSVIDSSKTSLSGYKDKKAYENAQKRLVINFEFEQIKVFKKDYDFLYSQLYTYFYDIWRDDEQMPGDDGYNDLLSSIIGKGKMFTKKCIDDQNIFIRMAKTSDYVENFSYILTMNKEEYIRLRSKYDTVYKDTITYNL